MVDAVKILGALLGGGGLSSGSGANILKTILGAATQGQQSDSSDRSTGGLGGLLGEVLKSTQGSSNAYAGGLGDILGSVLGGAQQQRQPTQQGKGLDGLLGGLLGGMKSGGSTHSGADGLGNLIESALNQFGNSEMAAQKKVQLRSFEEHSPGMVHDGACEQATIMVKAMINAAKSDGRVDQQEHEQILGKLGSVSQDEIDFVNKEMAKPLDIKVFARNVPKGLENQVYAMSLMAIDLDSNKEAQYLHQLASEMNITPENCNKIHKQLGTPELYT